MTFDEWCAANGHGAIDDMVAPLDRSLRALMRTAWDAAVAAERERCAKVCEALAKEYGGIVTGSMATEKGRLVHQAMANGAATCAEAIRGGGA